MDDLQQRRPRDGDGSGAPIRFPRGRGQTACRLLPALLAALLLPSARSELVTVTAYCPCAKCCGKWAGGRTADGHMPAPGVTCAASRSVPFGTRLLIPGVGWRTVQDRLARRFDGRVDVLFATHAEAVRFGKQKLEVRKETR